VHFGDVADFVRIGAGADRPLERVEYVDADFGGITPRQKLALAA